MKRPSRRLRESATTTLKNGRFLAPPRASRMTTISDPVGEEKGADYMTKRQCRATARIVVRVARRATRATTFARPPAPGCAARIPGYAVWVTCLGYVFGLRVWVSVWVSGWGTRLGYAVGLRGWVTRRARAAPHRMPGIIP